LIYCQHRKNIDNISSSSGCSIITYTTLFVHRGENAKVVAALKAKEFEEVTEELLKTGRLSYVELYKCRNFLEIAKRADEMISVSHIDNKEHVENEHNEQDNFSFDWLMRFFDAVGNISNEDLQNLWEKVLASEIVRPKACSLRTLDMIRNMSPEEANNSETGQGSGKKPDNDVVPVVRHHHKDQRNETGDASMEHPYPVEWAGQ